MLGMMLLSAGLGIAKGIGTYSQGKAILKSGRRIGKEYEKIGENKALFDKSLDEQKKTAKTIRDLQEGTALTQYERNRKESKKALENGIRGVLYQHIAQRENLQEQVEEMRSKILISSERKGVESHSLKHDALATLYGEERENVMALQHNKNTALEEVAEQGAFQDYKIGQDYDNMGGAIRRNYYATLGSAEMQHMQDITQMYGMMSQGRQVANGVIQQGYDVKAQGSSQIVGSLWNAALGGFSQMGGFDMLDNKLGAMFGGGQTTQPSRFENSLKTFGQVSPFGVRDTYYKKEGFGFGNFSRPYIFGGGIYK